MKSRLLQESLPGLSRSVPAISEHLKSLRCLMAVVTHGSAKRAAEAIFLSQPAVTRAVIELEQFCELPLFERFSRGMQPTVPGMGVLRRASALFEHLERGAAEALALTAPAKRRVALPERFASAVSPSALKALVAVAAAESESRAGLALGVSQPAVHRALRSLEHLSGSVLFRRSVRGTRLTEPGEAMLRRVKLAFGEARAMESDIAAWRGDIRGRVVIGTLPLSVGLFLPQAVDAVRRLHPEVEITMVDGTYESLMTHLLHADIDVIVGALREPSAEVRQQVLFREPLAVIARPAHPCFERPSLSLVDLLEWEWIAPLPGTPASAALTRAFEAAGLAPPRDTLQANNAAVTRALVAGTDRLAITSYGQALDGEGAVVRVPVALPGTTRSIGFAFRDIGEPSPDLLAVLDALREAAGARESTPLMRQPG